MGTESEREEREGTLRDLTLERVLFIGGPLKALQGCQDSRDRWGAYQRVLLTPVSDVEHLSTPFESQAYSMFIAC